MGAIKQFFKEPLLWFLLTGAFIFLIDGQFFGDSTDDYRIEFSAGQIQSLRDKWEMQMGRAPSGEELRALINDRLREEILYREALRMGLDRDDTIVRRRMAQKLTFLIEDTTSGTTAEESGINAWFASNRERYRIPARYTFTHIYYSESSGSPYSRASQGISDLAVGVDPDQLGDPFMLRKRYVEKSAVDIGRLFGDTFAAAIPGLEVQADWQGPIESSYGFHLLRLDRKLDPRTPEFDEIKDRVTKDYLAEWQRKENETRYQQIRARYQIVVPES